MLLSIECPFTPLRDALSLLQALQIHIQETWLLLSVTLTLQLTDARLTTLGTKVLPTDQSSKQMEVEFGLRRLLMKESTSGGGLETLFQMTSRLANQSLSVGGFQVSVRVPGLATREPFSKISLS